MNLTSRDELIIKEVSKWRVALGEADKANQRFHGYPGKRQKIENK